MATWYVQEQGALLRKQDQRLVVTKAGQVVQEVPLGKLDQVVLMRRGVQISTALLVDLIDRGIPVLLTNRSGSYVPWGRFFQPDLQPPRAATAPLNAMICSDNRAAAEYLLVISQFGTRAWSQFGRTGLV